MIGGGPQIFYMKLTPQQQEVIRRCQKSAIWFMSNFVKIKHPGAGIVPFVPFDYQQHAIRCFRKHRMNIFRKTRQCFRGDQMVWTPNGPKRIDSIVVGDDVYTFNGLTNSLDVTKVQEVYDNGETDCIQITSESGHTSICTADHIYFTSCGQIEAGELVTGDLLFEINEPQKHGNDPLDCDIILLSYLVAAGRRRKGTYVIRASYQHVIEFQNNYELKFNHKLPIKSCENKQHNGFTHCVTIDRRLIRNWLKSIGIHERIDARLPQCVFGWNNRAIALLLDRIMAIHDARHTLSVSKSAILFLHQIKQLLSRFGINSRIVESGSRIARLYSINYSFSDLNTLMAERNSGHCCRVRKGRVLEVVPVAGKHRVYDLRVGPYDNYIVDGVVVHNCGISKVSGVFALWYGMFAPHKTILIVSRKDDDAMNFLAENIRLPFGYLPDWMRELWKPVKDNEHELVFPNGSKIKSLTSHQDVLRSNASSLNIIDEAAFIQGMDAMWAAGRPVITHGGSFIVISTCVAGDTYLMTANGLCQIGDFSGNFQHYDDGYYHKNYDGPAVYGRHKLQQPLAFYKRDQEETRRIVSKMGYEIEAHIKHRLWACRSGTGTGWIYADEVQPGDFIAIKRGMMQFGDADDMNFQDSQSGQLPFVVNRIDEELAGIIGLIISHGSISDDCVTITSNDRSVHDWLLANHWGLNWASCTSYIQCTDKRFIRFLRWLGCKFGPAHDRTIPRRLWSCSRNIIVTLLNCMQDNCCTDIDVISYTSVSRELIKQVRMLLLNLGIVCQEEYCNASVENYIDQRCEPGHWRLLVSANKAREFRRLATLGSDYGIPIANQRELIPNVGYWLHKLCFESGLSIDELSRRGINLPLIKHGCDLTERAMLVQWLSILSDYSDYSAYRVMVSLADESIYWDEVTSVTVSVAETFDFTIPGDHTFWSNGMISHNTNGVGDWYWNTWTDAEAGANDFNPLMVNWWDMKWSIEYVDTLSGEKVKIAPTDGIIPTRRGTFGSHPRYGKVELLPEKYGPYWSPWLEEQYRDLQSKGEAWRFDQEILAEFIGSGNTVLPKSVLVHIGNTINNNYEVVTGLQTYVNPVTGDAEEIDFTPNEPHEGLWIWRKPVTATPDKLIGGRVVQIGQKAHTYVMGVDIATGKGRDYHALEVFDVDTMEQVAEGMFHCLPSTFKKIIDRVGRWYNCALTNVERNNGGDMIIDDLNTEFNYPRLWRRTEFNGKSISVGQYGFFTSSASKPGLNKFLLDYIRDQDGQGFRIYSWRLLKQLQIYVRKRDRSGRDTGKTEAEAGAGNHDDLVMATGLALVAVPDSVGTDAAGVMPFTAQELSSVPANHTNLEERQKELIDKGGVLMPMSFGGGDDGPQSIQEELMKFTSQLGGLPTLAAMRARMAAVNKKKHQL